jgi:dimethylhistidine N-methyltransferase
MTPPRSPAFIHLGEEGVHDQRREIAAGLLGTPATVAPKYFYDALGSRLFAAITELPEYYPTRSEAAIFAAHGQAMARCLPATATLVDLGAGNCEKAAGLFPVFQPARYVAVDISLEFLRDSLGQLQRRFPELEMVGVAMDFSRRLALPLEAGAGPRVLFYPGSSIGNFTPAEAREFLRQVRDQCHGGGLLIGVDLVKPVEVLAAAYDDPLQVTAAFNRNLLLHLNRLLGSDFALVDWVHRARFDAGESRIEMHLEARRALTVRWPGGERGFVAGERIHTENSYKWRLDDFADLLASAGFTASRHWTDEQGWFAVYWAEA